MYALRTCLEVDPIDVARERVYEFLSALLSHPDGGNWGCALRGEEQRKVISAVDSLRARAESAGYGLLCDECPPGDLDVRRLVLELCQPLGHLKEEYERVFRVRRVEPACSPYELNHRDGADGVTLAESLDDLVTTFRSTGFAEEYPMTRRPDHLASELRFMGWLIARKCQAIRLAAHVGEAAEDAALCDLAQRNFFGHHLTDWVTSFATGLQTYTGEGYLEALGRFLTAWVPFERHHLGLEPGLREREHATATAMAVVG